ncbi:PREDICTED: LOW QUALITY PROTEIN: subtilisin-like protease SBT4.5 [Tarenaya hassleriana]|uniref:LOW QUALITY PROTEIN: subtilisin-like protease SBT4.5 n=1 Tax=Tarenaya hassleriana TaxID=28532 RepID=UPI0008FD074A|nr:PREDICTED: LOW QUALITY PROTEIN: subtilisin-like protease SBT4.5 [Tarenaya hassleriana]
MAKPVLVYCLLLCLLVLSVSASHQDEDRQVYIVYMGAIPSNAEYMPTSQHINILQEVTGESSIENRLVRSYRRSFNGFAATLSDSERERVANMEGVVSVFPSRKLQLQTTASWDFMGFKENKTKRVPNLESDIIVGVIDSGIWPESASFDDNGFGPAPSKWKGECAGGKNFTCNNKIIGARYYTSSGGFSGTPESARDHIGHGSHTASTAAGNSVEDASFYGLGLGTARGGVPAARIAAYKVCDPGGCSSDGLLSAFDDAIADGVDIITISIGGDTPARLEQDTLAIGAFHAMAKGILTVNSAGNSGPSPGTTSSVAPWILSVAASNSNRAFFTKVILGDGKTIVGRSVNSFDLKGKRYDLVYGKSASRICDEDSARFCSSGCLDSELVNGKIVLCDSSRGIVEAEMAGAVGTIVKTAKSDVSFVFSSPVAALFEDQYETVVSYVTSTEDPKVSILKSDASMKETAPVVASFSSRGPNTIIPDILKPDLTAPGVEILAAYSLDASPSAAEHDTRRAKYSVLSGTSMSCPHVAGAAAYLKTFHPNWSPSMIKSAIMTTTWPMNSTDSAVGSEFGFGAGHLNPLSALHPGLVYESTKADHIALLCALNFTTTSLRLISGDNSTCTAQEKADTLPRNLNYPSMAAAVSSRKAFNVTFVRTVTNVGMVNSTYKAEVVKGAVSSKIDVKVEPDVLSMKSVYEKKSFTVTVSGESPEGSEPVSATLVWSDVSHTVRSPIVIYAARLF